ncbi:hypothetical protein MICAI_1880009 [Microcystis sp. T1-4]|nr:hypothetical protein MICAI_1880009 [Microcystis sp. T1-4]
MHLNFGQISIYYILAARGHWCQLKQEAQLSRLADYPREKK